MAREKIASQLLQAIDSRMKAAGHQAVGSAIVIAPDGRTIVDITATVTDAVLARIHDLGGSVISSFPQYNAIRASMPANQIETLASMPQVKFIRPAEVPATNRGQP